MTQRTFYTCLLCIFLEIHFHIHTFIEYLYRFVALAAGGWAAGPWQRGRSRSTGWTFFIPLAVVYYNNRFTAKWYYAPKWMHVLSVSSSLTHSYNPHLYKCNGSTWAQYCRHWTSLSYLFSSSHKQNVSFFPNGLKLEHFLFNEISLGRLGKGVPSSWLCSTVFVFW